MESSIPLHNTLHMESSIPLHNLTHGELYSTK